MIATGPFAFPVGQAVGLLRPAMSQLLVTFFVPFVIAISVVVGIGVCEGIFAIKRTSQSRPTGGGPAAA